MSAELEKKLGTLAVSGDGEGDSGSDDDEGETSIAVTAGAKKKSKKSKKNQKKGAKKGMSFHNTVAHCNGCDMQSLLNTLCVCAAAGGGAGVDASADASLEEVAPSSAGAGSDTAPVAAVGGGVVQAPREPGPIPNRLPLFRGVRGFTDSYVTTGQTDPPSITVSFTGTVSVATLLVSRTSRVQCFCDAARIFCSGY